MGVVGMVPVAVPDKIFGLTLFLDFVDRGHSLGSLLPPPAALPSFPLVSTYSTMPARGYTSYHQIRSPSSEQILIYRTTTDGAAHHSPLYEGAVSEADWGSVLP